MTAPAVATAPKSALVPQTVSDQKGVVLKLGDIVNVPCKVVDLGAGEEHSNLGVETVHCAKGKGGQPSRFGLNGGQVLKQ
jgi:hypothetical protein